MANLMEDIVSFYSNLGLTIGYGVDAFVDTMPEKPDKCLAINEYQGFPQGSLVEAALRNIQIVNRDVSADVARKRALDLYDAIRPSEHLQDLTNERWSLIAPKQTPFKLKVDPQGRTYYVFNLEIITYVDYN
jgi:hypothetical protein